MNLKDYKHLSFQYFEGTLPREKESILYDFVSQKENHKTFREWEQEWCRVGNRSNNTSEAWFRLKTRMLVRYTSDRKPVKKIHWTSRTFLAMSAVAAALVIGLFLGRDRSMPGQFDFESPAGTRSKIILPDSSIVWLNSGTHLRVSSLFGKKNRTVNLCGEGYFEVNHNDGHSFIVKAKDCDVTVHGTKFNVTAYASDNYVRTSVLEGVVQFRHDNQALNLTAGQTVEYQSATNTFKRISTRPESLLAWRENRIEYEDITLKDLAEVLSRNYAIQVLILSDEAEQTRLNISLRNNETIDEIVQGLSRVLPFSVKKEGNTILIK